MIHLLAGWTLYREAGGPRQPEEEQVLARHIRRCAAYTYHLRAAELGYNHMLKNLVALAVFEGCTSAQAPWSGWLAAALPACAEAQFLADGGHVERSPIYQGLALQDLEIAVALDAGAAQALTPLVSRARDAWTAMLHPDGEIALFNDVWIGEAPPPAQLGASPLEAGQQILREIGYGRLAGRGDCVLFDAGPVGPDDNPGHAHADFLSFELSIDGKRAVVDTGTPTYSAGPLRNACRAARAHNGPRLAGLEPMEAWASFRVGARGKAGFLVKDLPDGLALLWLAGTADGYERQAGIAVSRWLGLWPGRQLLVVDCWSNSHSAALTDLLLANDVSIQAFTGTEVSRSTDQHWPRLGAPEPVKRVSLAPQGQVVAFCLRWGEAVVETGAIAAQIAEALACHLDGFHLAGQPRLPPQ